MLKYWLLSLICIRTVAVAQVPLDETGKLGRVEIHVVDGFGDTVAGARITISPLSSSPARSGVDLFSVVLEYGSYRLSIEMPGFGPASFTVTVNRAINVFVVGLPMVQIENVGDVNVVDGKIRYGQNQEGCRIVRLVPLFLSTSPIDVVVSGTGEFHIDGITAGRYTALLLGGEGVCAVAQASIQFRRRQKLDLNFQARGRETERVTAMAVEPIL